MKKAGVLFGIFLFIFLAFVLLKGGKEEIKKEEKKGELPVQEIAVRVDGTQSPGYFLSHTTVQKGSRVRLNFVTDNEYGCARAISIPSQNINEVLPETGLKSIEFIADKEGEIPILCAMGMFWATLKVV